VEEGEVVGRSTGVGMRDFVRDYSYIVAKLDDLVVHPFGRFFLRTEAGKKEGISKTVIDRSIATFDSVPCRYRDNLILRLLEFVLLMAVVVLLAVVFMVGSAILFYLIRFLALGISLTVCPGLRWAGSSYDAILGDLQERHALLVKQEGRRVANRWFYSEVFSSLISLSWVALKRISGLEKLYRRIGS